MIIILDIAFKHIQKQYSKILPQFYSNQCFKTCDYSFGVNFMWRDYNYSEYAIDDNVLFIKNLDFKNNYSFFFPISTDFTNGDECIGKLIDKPDTYPAKAKLIAALTKIESYCDKNNFQILYKSVPEKAADFLSAYYKSKGNLVSSIKSEDWYDYLYNAQDLITYKGKKFAGQRNHINKFIKTYGTYEYHPLTAENKQHIAAFMDEYINSARADGNQNKLFFFEAQKAKECFVCFDEIAQIGGFITLKGKIIAVALGEIVRDTLFIHIEKALKNYNGAYQIIVKEFPRDVFENCPNGKDIRFINREEDMGIEGLRKSKLSYHPCDLLYKYTVSVCKYSKLT